MVRWSVDPMPDQSLTRSSSTQLADHALLAAEESARYAAEVCAEIDRDLDGEPPG